MKVIRKHPGLPPEVVEVGKDLESIWAELDGYIETVTIAEDLVILCDEEGRLKGKKPNVVLKGLGIDIMGAILVAGTNGENFCDVPRVDEVLWDLFRMVRYGRADRGHNVWKCRRCGHMERFEADGPYENGWNVCPSCAGAIHRPVGHGTAGN